MSQRKSVFAAELASRNRDPSGRRWIYLPYDQLSDELGALAREEPGKLGIVLIESPAKAARRPYHKQKLAWILANQRHFALEQAARGVAVRYVESEKGYREPLEALARELGPLEVMRPAERELRTELAPLFESGALKELPHEGWLTTRAMFLEGAGKKPPWRMDRFYRHARRTTGILMDGSEPVGGRFSFDADNRRPWQGDPPAPEPPRFDVDPVKQEVSELIERRFTDHPGRLDMAAVPATKNEAEALWEWAKRECLESFGPYEDAMSRRSRGLFHTRLSTLLHLHRILPRRVVEEVESMHLPIGSKEGLIRQVLGWREFVRHVHEETDGFRTLERDASPSFLGAARPLPPAFWGEPSGLACLDQVVGDVWDEGYGHHITRLMVLGNLATLLDVSPRELTDWFWVAYVDAFDWVVEPNVLGMATFGAGDLMTTKPYVSGSAYIHRMSDFCESCAFDPKRDCPITRLYWAFLARHEEALAQNPRLRPVMWSLRRRRAAEKAEDARSFETVSRALTEGRRLQPETAQARAGAGRS